MVSPIEASFARLQEMDDSLSSLAFYADKFDNELADEFGAKVSSEQQ